MRIRIYPYRQGSRSARALADALGGRVLKLDPRLRTYQHRDNDVIICWGQSDFLGLAWNYINNPNAIQLAANKLHSFNMLRLQGVRVPEFWTDAALIPDDAFPIVCRTVLNGSCGVGIVIAEMREALVRAPLYVRYVRKQDEYRIHVAVVDGQPDAFSVQRKARRIDVEQPNWRVRNHANGFNFVRDGVVPPADVIEQAKQSIIALGLDFGAADVIWNERRQQAYVLEINTAPGLEGQTIDDYATVFRRMIGA